MADDLDRLKMAGKKSSELFIIISAILLFMVLLLNFFVESAVVTITSYIFITLNVFFVISFLFSGG